MFFSNDSGAGSFFLYRGGFWLSLSLGFWSFSCLLMQHSSTLDFSMDGLYGKAPFPTIHACLSSLSIRRWRGNDIFTARADHFLSFVFISQNSNKNKCFALFVDVWLGISGRNWIVGVINGSFCFWCMKGLIVWGFSSIVLCLILLKSH